MRIVITYKSLFLLTLFSIGGALSPLSVYAASEQPTYKIEAIVFKTLSGAKTLENWPSWADKTEKSKAAPRSAEDHPVPVKLQQQPSANSNLNKLMERMVQSGDYIVLDHRAWFQYADARSSSPASYYESRHENIGHLNGHIQFYMSRFLHINIDLDLVPEYFDDERTIRSEQDNNGNTKPVYTIKQSKRIVSEEYYYFDHPEFGVIIYIRPIKS